MALTYSHSALAGMKAPDFSLPGVDGRTYTLHSFAQAKALTVVFMCNHCPYVVAVKDRLNALALEHQRAGAVLVGINSNDTVEYPEDDFEAMVRTSREWGMTYPYLFDESQSVARAYQAACTPDPYLFENTGAGGFILRYHGRIDDSWKDPAAVTQRDLSAALQSVLAGRPVAVDAKPSMGCNIKWKSV